MPEFKAVPQAIQSITGRTVTGIFAVHGNVDSYTDRTWPGSMSKTIAERGPRDGVPSRVKFLWSHDSYAPPVAVVDRLHEVAAADLPLTVRAKAPDATGGVEVTRTYLDTPRGTEILTALQAGAIDEMSYAYDVFQADFAEEPTAEGTQTRLVRNIREIKLYECSDVVYGANDATVASKAQDGLLAQIRAFLHSLKAGARHSAADLLLINQIHQLSVALGATSPAPTEDALDGKSRAAYTALTSRRLRLIAATLPPIYHQY